MNRFYLSLCFYLLLHFVCTYAFLLRSPSPGPYLVAPSSSSYQHKLQTRNRYEGAPHSTTNLSSSPSTSSPYSLSSASPSPSLLSASVSAIAPAALKAAPPSSSSSSSSTPSSTPSSPSLFTQSLRGYLRGHKCLFDDSTLPNGNLAFLLRGCDSSQRYVYPLELATNQTYLPGARAAQVMFERRVEAVSLAREAIFGKEGGKEGGMVEKNSAVGEILYEDVERFHRVLQYGVAAGMTEFMRKEVLAYNAALYQGVGVNLVALATAVETLSTYYSEYIKGEDWTLFHRSLSSMAADIQQIQQSLSEATPSSDDLSELPVTWETSPDPRTLARLLVQPLAVK